MNERTIFMAALDLDDAVARRAYLDESCHNRPELRKRVEALIHSHEQAVNFLDSPPPGIETTDVNSTSVVSEVAGDTTGPYKLLQQIGEGGMGAVYMAKQTQPVERTVALKIIKPGMDTRQVIARFEAERQALALMDHPNIARVLDAGATETGRPYFVMDLVKGVPITEYCDAQQLSVRQRLELVVAVCHAVQHAHQKGIIHRDLKPSNVLVAEYDGRPVPKVIDFGVAKATSQQLTERTMFTRYGQIIGTFEYMSPEQSRFNQLDVDTRSDIYSLGVLMYELLTGSTPFEKQRLETASFDETLRIIRDEEPPPPSTRLQSSNELASIAARRQSDAARLGRSLRGELDWIVMKALEKDRNRRYETASALAADITRYLNDEPISAAAPSRLYQFAKFVKRNRAATLAAAAVMAGLIAGVVGLSMGVVSQARQRAAAERERATAQLDLASALQALGKYAEAEELYRRGLARPSEVGSEAKQQQARTRLRLAQVVRQQQGAATAEPLFRQALDDYRSAFPTADPNIAFALGQFGILLRDSLGKHAQAEPIFREQLAIHRQVRPVDHVEIAKSLLNIGNTLCWQQKFAEAEPIYRESVREYEVALPEGDSNLALARTEYSYVLIRLDRFAEAEAHLLQSEMVLRTNPPWRLYITAGLTCLYAKWDQAEPGKGYDAIARRWTLKILDAYFKKQESQVEGSRDAKKD